MGYQQRDSVVVLRTPHGLDERAAANRASSPPLSQWHMVAGLQILDLLTTTILIAIVFTWLPPGAAEQLFGEPVILGSILSLAFYMVGAYSHMLISRPGRSILMVTIACMAVLGPALILHADPVIPSKETEIFMLGASAAMICLVTANRLVFAWLYKRCSRAGLLAYTICLIGAGSEAQACVDQLRGRTTDTLVLGHFHVGEHRAGGAWAPDLGHVSGLAAYLREQRVDEIIVATPGSQRQHLSQLVEDLGCLPAVLSLWPGTVNLPVEGLSKPGRLDRLALLPLRQAPLRGWAWMFKDVQDRTIAALLLFASLPVLLLISLAIRVSSPGPVFYRQSREGYCGRPFSIFKFRTMHVAKSEPANRLVLTAKNDNRVFPLGAFLRRTSLDELPQLLNVLNGDMWLMGPRPHSSLATAGGRFYADAVPHYSARHRMKPGITGWAQINGWRGPTNTIEQIQQRVTHDLYYIDHWSPLLDLRILLLTAVHGFVHKNAF